MSFVKPVVVGDEVSFYGKVIAVGRTSIKVHIEAWRRLREGEETVRVTEATFTFVAIDEHGRPRVVP